MATAQFTSKVRPHRNRPSKSRTRSARSRPRTTPSPLDRPAFRAGLVTHIGTVQEALCVAITCCNALRYQAADADLEIATVLRVCCSGKLYGAIQEAGVLLALLDGKAGVDPQSDDITSRVDSGGIDLS